jgi:methyl-accepting chemotaxis protein
MSEVDKTLATEIESVVRMFDSDGTMAANCREILTHVDEHIPAIASTYWSYWTDTKKIEGLENSEYKAKMVEWSANYIRERLQNAMGNSWHNGILAQVTDARRRNIGLSDVLAANAYASIQYHVFLAQKLDRTTPDYLRLSKTIIDFSNADLAIIATCYTHYQTSQMLEKQINFTNLFESDITSTAVDISDQANILRQQAAGSSAVAQGMLSKASEVATASEQSAVAMREAAQTAAGLIRAIEDTRSEVELAAEVANRATDRAQEAVEATDTLSDQSKSIESILGLIRDIAGQTNLLALNATIEAARAGDAGRGFAVVAQEVKSLANQTAKATDEIAEKIAAIQSATKASVESNVSIRATVQDVHHSAERIRHAMEEQAQTVTMITASVDETALAADLMSNTISAIRADTENVVSEISMLEQGFADVETKISALQANAGRFVSNLMR